MKILSLILLVALTGCGRQAMEAPKPSTSSNVTTFYSNPPTGILGKHLGERMVITGQLVKVPMENNNQLAVATIDGTPLQAPLHIEIVGGVVLQNGISYELEGYESGGFGGAPLWISPPLPQKRFQYWPSFVVTKVVQPKSNP